MAYISNDRVLARKGFSGRDIEQFRRLCDAFKPLPAKLLLAPVLKHPKILRQRADTLAANANASARLLGVDARDFLRLAASQPALLHLRPAGLEAKISEGCAAFDIPRQSFIEMCLKRPSLLTMTTVRIAGPIVDAARLLATDVKPLTCAFLKRPALLTLNPETIAANAAASAALLGLSLERFVRCALLQPQLLYMKPQTLLDNATRSAAQLDVSVDAFMAAAVRQPGLLFRTSASLAVNARLLTAIMQATGEVETLEELIARYPAGLTYAPGHLKARLLVAKLGLSGAKVGNLISTATRIVDALLVAHYRETAPFAEAERTIRDLHAQDIIKDTSHRRQNIVRTPRRRG